MDMVVIGTFIEVVSRRIVSLVTVVNCRKRLGLCWEEVRPESLGSSFSLQLYYGLIWLLVAVVAYIVGSRTDACGLVFSYFP